MRNAFKKWSSVTNLDFKEQAKNPDIRVRFEQGQHADVFAFDGPGGVLAHAFYPSPDPTDGKYVYLPCHESRIKPAST